MDVCFDFILHANPMSLFYGISNPCGGHWLKCYVYRAADFFVVEFIR